MTSIGFYKTIVSYKFVAPKMCFDGLLNIRHLNFEDIFGAESTLTGNSLSLLKKKNQNKPNPKICLGAIQIIRDTFSALLSPPPPPV
jgi:hypothetical protein